MLTFLVNSLNKLKGNEQTGPFEGSKIVVSNLIYKCSMCEKENADLRGNGSFYYFFSESKITSLDDMIFRYHHPKKFRCSTPQCPCRDVCFLFIL